MFFCVCLWSFRSSAALAAKFVVRLSSLAYNLLSLFLVQSDLVLIASIINNKISFKKLDDARISGSVTEDMLLVELPDYTAGEKSSTTFPFLHQVCMYVAEYVLD